MADFFEPEREKQSRSVFLAGTILIDLTSRVAINAKAPESGLLVLRQIGDARLHNLQILHEVYEPGADTGETMLQHGLERGRLCGGGGAGADRGVTKCAF